MKKKKMMFYILPEILTSDHKQESPHNLKELDLKVPYEVRQYTKKGSPREVSYGELMCYDFLIPTKSGGKDAIYIPIKFLRAVKKQIILIRK